MTKEQFKKFREHYFPEETNAKSMKLLCKEFPLTVRCAMSWEYGQNPIQPWFVKAANDFDKDGVLERSTARTQRDFKEPERL